MTTVVFIPGILGSKLSLGSEEVWPPTPLEVVFGYGRIDKLVSPGVKSSGVIESQCVPVYGPMLDALRKAEIAEHGYPDLLVPWDYDWRQDLASLATSLATQLDTLAQARPDPIVILCHSMGGLIVRYCLEYAGLQAAWQGRIPLVIFMATPHDGAPLAIARATGTGGSSLGLSAVQLRQLCGTPGYPSDYQLFPLKTAPVIWRTDALDPFTPQSLGDTGVPTMLGLNPDSLARAFDFQSKLDPSARPARRRYFSIVSAAHETITRFDGTGTTITAVSVKNSGDGTVPIQSAAALHDQTAFVIADHMGVAKNDTTIDLVLMLLGKQAQGPIAAAADAATTAPTLAAAGTVVTPTLSLSQSFIAANESYEIVIAIPLGTQKLDARIVIVRGTVEGAGNGDQAIQTLDVAAQGPDLSLVSLAGPKLDPGLYSFTLQIGGTPDNTRQLLVSPAVEDNIVSTPA